MIGIIDYGMGNLKSVKNALDKLSIDCVITNDKEVIKSVDALILPGVGAFKEAMDNLIKYDLVDLIKEESERKPFLGICLGMQLLFEEGYEVEVTKGLGLLKGKVVLMEADVKIPHIGFNKLEINKEDSLINNSMFMYYVHSYYVQDYDFDNLISYSNYGGLKIPGIMRKGNIIGCQFHPEKSGYDGLYLLEKFKELIV